MKNILYSKMLAVIILLCCCLGKTFRADAQHQNWAFGYEAGLSFNGVVHPLPPTQIHQFEGAASVSDKQGNLLFYTDGRHVWDALNAEMPGTSGPDSLGGKFSSTQAAVIVPAPGFSKKYYIFTTAAPDGPSPIVADGFKYSIVDMSLPGSTGGTIGAPHGDVITASRNTVLYKNSATQSFYSSEKVAAVRKCNGKDYWIVTHETSYFPTDTFIVYSLTSSGVSFAGKYGIGRKVTENIAGYLKFSPNGKTLVNAMCTEHPTAGLPGQDGGVDVFDFDITTGAISNFSEIPNPVAPLTYLTYGVEFSPDGQYLYTSNTGDEIHNKYSTIFQFDLAATNIFASSVLIDSKMGVDYTYLYGALQIGPDGKIYVAQVKQNSLGVINNPNNAGAGSANSDFVPNAVVLSPSAKSQLGLPNNFAKDIDFLGDSINRNGTACDSFYIGNENAPITGYTYHWTSLTPGTPDPAPNNIPYVKVHPLVTSVYLLTVHAPNSCVTDSIYDTVNVRCCQPIAVLHWPDTVCVGYNDTLRISGGVWGKIVIDNRVLQDSPEDTNWVFSVDSFVASGGLVLPISADGIGHHRICYIAYSANPDSTVYYCTDTVCKNFEVINCCTPPVALLTINGSEADIDTICYGDTLRTYTTGGSWVKSGWDGHPDEDGDYWRPLPQSTADLVNDPTQIGMTHRLCMIVTNDTMGHCADTICRTIYIKNCCTKPIGIFGAPDTLCAGTKDTIRLGGAPYARLIVDGKTDDGDKGGLFPVDRMNQLFGGLPIDPSGWELGTHHVCFVYYSANPDSVPFTCSDTICRDIVIKNCGCNAFQGESLPQITQVDGFIYDFTCSFDDNTTAGPDFVNWYVDGVMVGQTTTFGHLTDTLVPGSHVVCMEAAHILFNAGPNGNSVCCYDRQCTTVNIDACISWKATDSISYSYDPANYRKVNYTFHGSTSPLSPTIIWDFGDGNTAIGKDLSVTHQYTGDNTYNTCAIIIWSKGDSITYDSLGVCCCVDTICLPVTVSPCSPIQFGIDKSTDGDAHSYHLTHSAGFISVTNVKWVVSTPQSASIRPEHGVYMNYTGSDVINTICADVDYTIELPGGDSTKCPVHICIPDTFGDVQSMSRIRTYPNPTSADVVIEITNYQGGKNALIEVYDMTGQMVMTDHLTAMSKGTSQNVINIGKMPAGIYTMRVTIDDRREVSKLIKQ